MQSKKLTKKEKDEKRKAKKEGKKNKNRLIAITKRACVFLN